MHFFLAALVAAHGLSLVASSRGYSLVVMCGLSIAVVSLVAWALHWWASVMAARRLNSCGSQVLKQAQELWYPGLVVPRHMGSSQTCDRTHFSCIGRWILNHWTTKAFRVSAQSCPCQVFFGICRRGFAWREQVGQGVLPGSLGSPVAGSQRGGKGWWLLSLTAFSSFSSDNEVIPTVKGKWGNKRHSCTLLNCWIVWFYSRPNIFLFSQVKIMKNVWVPFW